MNTVFKINQIIYIDGLYWSFFRILISISLEAVVFLTTSTTPDK